MLGTEIVDTVSVYLLFKSALGINAKVQHSVQRKAHIHSFLGTRDFTDAAEHTLTGVVDGGPLLLFVPAENVHRTILVTITATGTIISVDSGTVTQF